MRNIDPESVDGTPAEAAGEPAVDPPYKLESVDNVLRLLLLLRERDSVRVTDASAHLGVARSTAHRLLSMLTHHGFVHQDRVTKAYRAGRVLVEIGLATVGDLDIRRRAHSHLQRLSAETGETVNLMMLEGNRARFIDSVEGTHAVRVGSRTGVLLPAHSTSGGKALLAELPDDELDRLYAGAELTRVTDTTMTDLGTLREELAEVRRLGYATNLGESETGLNAVGVCIRDHRGRAIVALATGGPAARLTHGDVPAVARKLCATARTINQELG